MKIRAAVLVAAGLLVRPCAGSWGNSCALPLAASAGHVIASEAARTMALSMGVAGGVAASTGAVLALGYAPQAAGAYKCFLAAGAPSAPAATPGTPSVLPLVPSRYPTMQLEWMPAASDYPVTYQVYFGTGPVALAKVVSGLSVQSEMRSGLSYITPYFWQVSAVDPFGRSSISPVYSFSLAPITDHLIAAPNPFHPGLDPILLMFSMPGSGEARLEVYSLPDARRLASRRLDGLGDGVNVYAYDGRDDSGRLLPNGVFVVKLLKRGSHGNSAETFKIVSAR